MWLSDTSGDTESPSLVNPLAPGKFEWNFRHVIFKQILVIGGWGISCEIALIWMSLDFTEDQSTLVQVMAWCRQATSHYLSQSWPRSLLPYGVARPQCVNSDCFSILVSLGLSLPTNTFPKIFQNHKSETTSIYITQQAMISPDLFLLHIWYLLHITKMFPQINIVYDHRKIRKHALNSMHLLQYH